MITRVEPPTEECDVQIPGHRTVKSGKQACAACRSIPIIVSAGEDRPVTHVPDARLQAERRGQDACPEEGDYLGRQRASWRQAASTGPCTRAATLTHTGKQGGDDQI